MAGFKVRILTAGPHVVDDLGITLDTAGAAPVTEDLTSLSPSDIARSVGLLALIASDDIFIVDARDDTDATFMSKADSTEAVNNHNDTHFGISGGRFGAADDPTVVPGADYILQYNAGSGEAEYIDPVEFIDNNSDSVGGIIGGMGVDGTDTTFVYDGTASPLISAQDETLYDGATNNGAFNGIAGAGSYVVGDDITMSDGSVINVDTVVTGDVTEFTVLTSGGSNVTAGVTLTQASVAPDTGQSGFTITPEKNNIADGTIQWDVNDSFLRNTGDTLDSGTLTIASGATLDLPTGSNITIAGDVTIATIQTPGGGFANIDDIINKGYVDSIAGGFDYKESVRVGSTPADGDITAGSFGGSYATSPSNGQFTGVDLSSGTGATLDGLNFTGVIGTGLIIGDRVLIKDQTDAKENGIYDIDVGSIATSVILTRSSDFDGTPAAEVSGGATTFVDDTSAINATSVNSNTRWSVIGDDIVTLNTDDVDWTQTGGVGLVQSGIGLSASGAIIDLDVNDLTTATVVATDIIAFHDVNGTPEASGSQTRKSTFGSVFNELDVPNGITSDGFVVRTANDTYASRSITVNGAGALDGLAVSNGDGVSADPTVGLDINGLPARSTAVDTTDRVAVWRADGTNANEYYTIAEISGAAAASDSYSTWTNTGNGSGPTIGPGSSADTIDFNGGKGIDIDTVSGAPDSITFVFSDSGLSDTAVVGTDFIPFFDTSGAPVGTPEMRLVSSFITDLGLAAAAFTTIAGDTGTATADTGADTLNLIGATSGGITTTASDDPENVTFAITGADLITGSATLATGDFIIVNDSADAATTVSQKYTFGTMITDLGLITTTSLVAYGNITGGDGGTATAIGSDTITFNGTGINIQATNAGAGADTVAFVLDISDLTAGAGTIVAGDGIAVNDGGTTVQYLWSDVITDLSLVTAGYTTFGGDSGSTTPSSNADTINFVGGTNGGITTVASEPGTDEIGFSVTPIDLTTGGAVLTVSDFIIVSDSADAATTTALKYTFSDMIGDLNLLTTTTGVTDAYGLVIGGDGGVTATAIGTDTITVNGTGINVTTTNGGAAADTLDLVLDISDLTAGAGTIVVGDGVAVNDGGSTVQYLWSDVITDLGLLTAVTASADEDLLGIDVTSSSVIGLDILGLIDPAADLAATDEFAIHDKSEGTAGANRKITGTNVAEGAAAILGITGLTFTDINGQSMLTYIDSTRSNKVLSVDSNSFAFSDNTLDDGSWIEIGNAVDADASHVMPFDGTIVGISAMTENANSSTYELDIFINGAVTAGVASLTGTGVDIDNDTTLDLNFSQGDRLRIQVDRTAGTGIMQDTVANIFVRWRDV